jgi:hypothetical protein
MDLDSDQMTYYQMYRQWTKFIMHSIAGIWHPPVVAVSTGRATGLNSLNNH